MGRLEISFGSAVKREPHHFLVHETPENCRADNHIELPIWLPDDRKPIGTIIMINGFAEDAYPKREGPVKPELYENHLAPVFTEEGFGCILLPLPFHFMRHDDGEDIDDYHAGPRNFRSKDRFYLGYNQVMKDVMALRQELLDDYIEQGIMVDDEAHPVFLLGYSLGGMVALSSYVAALVDPSIPKMEGYFLLASGLSLRSVETTNHRHLGLLLRLTVDEVSEMRRWYEDESNVREMMRRAELPDSKRESLLWDVFKALWLDTPVKESTETWIRQEEELLRVVVGSKDPLIRAEDGDSSDLASVMKRLPGTMTYGTRKGEMSFGHFLLMEKEFRANCPMYLSSFIAHARSFSG
jgi:Alpha/beta hydrolase family